jgi:hypothetical protein
MRSVKVALAAGLTLLVLAIGLTLLGSPPNVARSNRLSGKPEEPIARITEGSSYCQPGELLPRGTSAIRVWLEADAGPRVHLVVYAHGHPVTSGWRGSNWIGGSVTVPVRPLARSVSHADVCVSFSLHDETVTMQGTNGPAPLLWIEYLRPGTRTWASLAGEIARHMGLGRATSGTWIVFVALALLAALVALASSLLIGEMP